MSVIGFEAAWCRLCAGEAELLVTMDGDRYVESWLRVISTSECIRVRMDTAKKLISRLTVVGSVDARTAILRYEEA